MALRGLIALALVGLGSVSAHAGARETYVLKDADCRVKVAEGKNWKDVPNPWKAGESVLGALAPGKDTVLYLFHRQKTYASPMICWSNRAGGAVSAGSSRRIGVAYLNWQETTSLVQSSNSKNYPLRANQSGWGIVYERDLKDWTRWRLGLVTGIFTAKSIVDRSEKDSATFGTLVYETSDAAAFGALVAPEFSWMSQSRQSSLGFALPVMFRLTNWPNPPAGAENYLIQNTRRVLPGFLVSLRFSRPGWEMSSRVGLLGSAQNLAWILGICRIF